MLNGVKHLLRPVYQLSILQKILHSVQEDNLII
jgi:hypothetical protein